MMVMMMMVVVVCRIYSVFWSFSRFLVGQITELSVGKRILLRSQENSKGQIHSRRRLTPAATINCRRRRSAPEPKFRRHRRLKKSGGGGATGAAQGSTFSLSASAG